MNGIPSYYQSDDLMLMALYDEGCKVCGNKPFSKTLDYPADSFDKKTQKKEKIKKGLKIGALIAAGVGAVLLGVKGFGKIKSLFTRGANAAANGGTNAAANAGATVQP